MSSSLGSNSQGTTDLFFSSIKDINGLNNYLKVTIDKNWPSQNLNFVGLKNLPPGQFLGSSNSLYFKTLKTLLKKNFMAPFYGWGSTASRLQPL